MSSTSRSPAIGVEMEASASDTSTETPAAPKPGRTREGAKQAQLIAMLRADGGAIDETVAATGLQAHTVGGAMAGALKKKLGLTIDSGKVDGRGRFYKLYPA